MTSDCDVGLTCGFLIGAGCSAQGVCLDTPVQCQDDAAACGTGGTICACNGQAAAIVLAGYASAPTASGAPTQGPCAADSGPPSGSDAGSVTDAAGASDAP